MRNIIIYLIPSEHCKFILCEIMVGFKNVEKRPSTAHSNFNQIMIFVNWHTQGKS